jgi:hypothetical protein
VIVSSKMYFDIINSPLIAERMAFSSVEQMYEPPLWIRSSLSATCGRLPINHNLFLVMAETMEAKDHGRNALSSPKSNTEEKSFKVRDIRAFQHCPVSSIV